MESQFSTQANTEEKSVKPRKKYEKPMVVYLAPLEAVAGLCVGVPPIQPGKANVDICDYAYINS